MARDKHHNKNKHDKDTTNENKNKRSESRLFTEVDAKAAEISDDKVNHGSLQASPSMQDRLVPLGVVEIDESVELPIPSSKSRHQNHDSKSHTSLRSSENHHTERVYLPPISQHHYPYEYYYPSPDYYHFGNLSYPYSNYYEHHSPHHRHQHQHHHRHHHKYKKEVETYDSRWWYMPINSVHRPKLERPPEQHYVAPKWYESINRQSRMQMNNQERKLSPRKYVDCRCDVCKPSRKAPHGTRWVVNE